MATQSKPQTLAEVLLRYKWRYILGILSLILTDLLQQVLPKLTGNFFQDLSDNVLNAHGLLRYAGLMIGTAVVIGAFRLTWRLGVFGTARMVEQDVRSAYFAHLEKLPASFYHQHKTGDLMAMATNDLQAVRGIAGDGILFATDSLMMTILTLGSMILTVGWRLSVLALLPLPILAVFAGFFGKMMHTRSRAVQDAFGKISDVTQENISGMRVVKAFDQEATEEAKFDVANRNYVARFMSMMRIQGALDPTIGVLAGICFMLALLFPGRAVLTGELKLGAFISLTMYINMLIWPMLAGGWVINTIQRGMGAYDRIRSVLLEEPDVATADKAVLPAEGAVAGQIEIRNLTFTYPGQQQPALSGLNVTVRPGETLGILGKTGSGKTTLVSLLARVFNPPEGTVFMDGIDVLKLPLEMLRQSIAFVPQESFLFSRTVGENIGYAPGNWAEEQIRHAAQTAQVEQDILEFLPHGYETMVGERGVTLSGGQRQRVGLSRAVLKEAPVLVLDDCLSAVDTSTEQRILNGLRPVMAGRTTVVISHRVAAVKAADQILVLDNGRIVERGTHDELLALGGRYWRTHQRQQLEEAIANEA